MSANPIPGTCDHCDRRATSYVGYWDSGKPGVGNHVTSSRCDYHLGNPPGGIEGRCWSCGKAITDKQVSWTYIRDKAPTSIAVNFHDKCPRGEDIANDYDGPQGCSRCEEPIGYGQDRDEHPQPRFNRTLYSHRTCPPIPPPS